MKKLFFCLFVWNFCNFKWIVKVLNLDQKKKDKFTLYCKRMALEKLSIFKMCKIYTSPRNPFWHEIYACFKYKTIILHDKFCPGPVGLFLLMVWNVSAIIVIKQPHNGRTNKYLCWVILVKEQPHHSYLTAQPVRGC